MKKILLSVFLLIIIKSSLYAEDPIKIMPVGNSITAGEHYHYPALEERTGYRKDLYWMLINAGYNVDFVGSQSHGIRSEDDEDWYDWNNEAYPGWKIPGIANKVKAALPIYKPDILLVHVGTNGSDWFAKPGQVSAMLDMINNFSVQNDHPITVFLCKIIKRFYKEDSGPTIQFNTVIADSAAARTSDKIKIILVDMESGAGLDYTDAPPDSTASPPYEGGDMWGETYPGVSYDKYHPNDKGNTKMAVKFYQPLIEELGEPTGIKNPGINKQPQKCELYQNYPNPFNSSTFIKYFLTKQASISLSVFDINGCLVETLLNSTINAGTHVIQWNPIKLASGYYFLNLQTEDFNSTKKCMLCK